MTPWARRASCLVTGILLLWVFHSVTWASWAFYMMTPDVPYEDRGSYSDGAGPEDLVREPFSAGPRAIAWCCVSVVALWLWARCRRASGRRPGLIALVLWLVGFLLTAALIATPMGRIHTRSESWHRVESLLDTNRAIEMYATEAP